VSSRCASLAAEGIDLAASHAYSDSESDLPMLRRRGPPVVVNPDADLRRIALEEAGRCCTSTGWGAA